MKAWEVIAIAIDGEFVCPDCTTTLEEEKAFEDEVEDMAPLFACDSTGEETCGRCGKSLRED